MRREKARAGENVCIMNINDSFSTNIRISVKTQCGKVVREITKTNKLTYQGADIVAAAMSQRGVLDINGLYVRYAQNEVDARAANTNFGETKDIRKVTKSDFEDTTGSAGGALIHDGSVAEPLAVNSNYEGNKLTFDFSYSAGDLGEDFTAGISEVYFMGLAKEEAVTTPPSTDCDGHTSMVNKIFSVLSLAEEERYTLAPNQQINVSYDIAITA